MTKKQQRDRISPYGHSTEQRGLQLVDAVAAKRGLQQLPSDGLPGHQGNNRVYLDADKNRAYVVHVQAARDRIPSRRQGEVVFRSATNPDGLRPGGEAYARHNLERTASASTNPAAAAAATSLLHEEHAGKRRFTALTVRVNATTRDARIDWQIDTVPRSAKVLDRERITKHTRDRNLPATQRTEIRALARTDLLAQRQGLTRLPSGGLPSNQGNDRMYYAAKTHTYYVVEVKGSAHSMPPQSRLERYFRSEHAPDGLRQGGQAYALHNLKRTARESTDPRARAAATQVLREMDGGKARVRALAVRVNNTSGEIQIDRRLDTNPRTWAVHPDAQRRLIAKSAAGRDRLQHGHDRARIGQTTASQRTAQHQVSSPTPSPKVATSAAKPTRGPH